MKGGGSCKHNMSCSTDLSSLESPACVATSIMAKPFASGEMRAPLTRMIVSAPADCQLVFLCPMLVVQALKLSANVHQNDLILFLI
jgi:hypothetical protein